MNYKKYIITLLFTGLMVTCCQSQNKEYGINVPTRVATKLNTIYPHAADINWNKRNPTDNMQIVVFNCNCGEGTGHLIITFDTNGAILNKDVFITKQDIPRNIADYIVNNYPNEFNYIGITKTTDNEGKISYTIELKQFTADGSTSVRGALTYILKFKGSGELVYVDKRP